MTKLKDEEKVFILIGIVLVLLLGYYVDRNNLIKKTYESLSRNVIENVEIEYGDKYDAYKYIDNKDNLEIIGDVDNFKVGKYDIKYLLKDITSRYNILIEREYDSQVNVVDTNKPIIELNELLLTMP